MQPIYIELGGKLPLMIVPDSDAHMDGHPVLTYSYAIYKGPDGEKGRHTVDTASMLAPGRESNPDYIGMLKFEQPGRHFSYEAGGHQILSGSEVEQLIEEVTRYRERPDLWRL